MTSEIKKEQKTVNDYVDLIEKVAQAEYSRLPKDRVDYNEVLNIGALAVHVLLTSNPDRELNNAYIATAMKWAIRNELRHRYGLYTPKKTADDEDKLDSQQKIREAVYETILSVERDDSGTTWEKGGVANVDSESQLERLEIKDLARNIREAMTTLPNQTRQVIEARFYKNLKRREIEESFYVSPLRILRMMQSGLDQIREKVTPGDKE